MKIVFISDTHGFHRKLALPEGDMIIHAGDVSNKGARKEIRKKTRKRFNCYQEPPLRLSRYF